MNSSRGVAGLPASTTLTRLFSSMVEQIHTCDPSPLDAVDRSEVTQVDRNPEGQGHSGGTPKLRDTQTGKHMSTHTLGK